MVGHPCLKLRARHALSEIASQDSLEQATRMRSKGRTCLPTSQMASKLIQAAPARDEARGERDEASWRRYEGHGRTEFWPKHGSRCFEDLVFSSPLGLSNSAGKMAGQVLAVKNCKPSDFWQPADSAGASQLHHLSSSPNSCMLNDKSVHSH